MFQEVSKITLRKNDFVSVVHFMKEYLSSGTSISSLSFHHQKNRKSKGTQILQQSLAKREPPKKQLQNIKLPKHRADYMQDSTPLYGSKISNSQGRLSGCPTAMGHVTHHTAWIPDPTTSLKTCYYVKWWICSMPQCLPAKRRSLRLLAVLL